MKVKTRNSFCENGHLFGNGKDVDFKERCPECGGEVAGFEERVIVTLEKAKGIWGSLSEKSN